MRVIIETHRYVFCVLFISALGNKLESMCLTQVLVVNFSEMYEKGLPHQRSKADII